MPIPVEQLIIKIAGDSKQFKKTMGGVIKDNKKAEGSFKKLAKIGAASFAAVGAAAVVMAAKATGAFLSFETGVTNVAKTTNLAGKDLKEFEKNIVSLSKEMPVSSEKLLEIATAAGQLGIKGVSALTKFTKTIALLGATTNVDGEEAALTLARLLNITGESTESVDQLGAALVQLGNNFATSEAEILEVSKDVAKATINFNLAGEEVLGISTAMASLGIAAEAGGTVVGKAFMSIDKAIRSQAGPAFDKLIELTGMTGDQLTKTFQTDASAVFQSFISGLGRAGESGKDMTAELEQMGLKGIRVNKILPTLANRHDVLTDSLKQSSQAYSENTALNEEAAQAFATNASKLQIAQNKVNATLVEIGEKIAPAVIEAMEVIADAFEDGKPALEILGEGIIIAAKAFVGLIKLIGKTARAIKELSEGNLDFFEKEVKQQAELKSVAIKRFKSEKDFLISLGKERTKAQRKRLAGIIATEKKIAEIEKRKEKLAADQKALALKQQAADKALQIELDEFEAEFDALEDSNAAKEAEQKRSNEKALELELDEFDAEFDALEDSNTKKAAAKKKADKKKEDEDRRHFGELEDLHAKHNDGVLLSESTFGNQMVALKEFQGTAEYGAVKTAAGQLSVLINSENDQLKAIGKAATIVQIGMSTAEGALKAYASLAWIPYVGIPLGVFAASVLTAYGGEQISEVARMAEGGIVGGIGGVGIGDKVPAFLEPGELVVPRDITADILKSVGARGMADGGKAVGAKESKKQSEDFADIFSVPGIFLSILGLDGGDSETSESGPFSGMVSGMMGSLEAAADELLRVMLSVVPGGDIIYEAIKLTQKPIEELKKILGDSAVIDILGELDISGGAIDSVVGAVGGVAGTAEDFVKGIFNFKNGGVAGMTSPGEMRLSQDALKAIANGVNTGNNNAMPVRHISSKSTSQTSQQRVGVDLFLNENLAEFVTAKQREGQNLNTLILP